MDTNATSSNLASTPQLTETSQTGRNQDDQKEKLIRCKFVLGEDYYSKSAESLELPEALVQNEDVFYKVLSRSTWNSLNSQQVARLLKLLPSGVVTSQKTAEDFLQRFFDDAKEPSSRFFFTNPLRDFQQKLSNGYYDAACADQVSELKACVRLQYEHRIREYYCRLMKRLLVFRRKALEAAALVPEGEPFSYDWKTTFVEDLCRRRCAINETSSSPTWIRAKQRTRLIIRSCRERVGEDRLLSSDDEDLFLDAPPESAPLPLSSNSPVLTAVQQGVRQNQIEKFKDVTFHSTMFKPNSSDLDMYDPMYCPTITAMLKEYRRLKRDYPEHPSLEFDDIKLDDIISRSDTEIKQLAQKLAIYKKNFASESAQTIASASVSTASRRQSTAKPPKPNTAQKEAGK